MSRASALAFMNFCVFDLIRVEQPDQRGAEDAFVDHAVQPVDRFLRLAEQRPDFAQHQLERNGDERNDAENGKRELPVDRKQQDAGADDQEKGGDDRGKGLRDEHLHRVDVGGEIGEKFGGRDLFHPAERLDRYLRRETRAHVARHFFRSPGLRDVLRIGQNEYAESPSGGTE